jgi:hypothetical protein
MKHSLTAVAAVALTGVLSATAAIASTITITIDDFTVEQTVVAALQGNPASGTVSGPEANIIGGVRHMQVRTVDLGGEAGTPAPVPGGRQTGTIFNAEGGALDFINDATSIGTGWLVYDGTEDRAGLPTPAQVAGLDFGASVNRFGLNADLLLGMPTGYFTFSAENFDQLQPNALTFSAFAWDMLGNAVGYFEEIDPLNFSPILGYDDFRANWNNPGSGLGGFDWGQVGALAFRVDSTRRAFDGQITGITATPIPLPASALLLLGGLGGLAGWSASAKRRRKA